MPIVLRKKRLCHGCEEPRQIAAEDFNGKLMLMALSYRMEHARKFKNPPRRCPNINFVKLGVHRQPDSYLANFRYRGLMSEHPGGTDHPGGVCRERRDRQACSRAVCNHKKRTRHLKGGRS